MIKRIISFLELFHFSIYNWIKRNTPPNWYGGPDSMSSGLICISLYGNFEFLLVKTDLSHTAFIFIVFLLIVIFYIYITFHYNEERFELIGERFEQLNKTQKIIIKNIAFVYLMLSFYLFYSAISLSS